MKKMSNSPKSVQQLTDGTQILKTSAPGGMRQLRCPNCGMIARPTRTAQGVTVTACPQGHRFTLQKM